jgi:hypothetical protein
MTNLYDLLKTDLEDFVKAAKLLTFAGCCKAGSPELKTLTAIVSFKSSLYLSQLRYNYEYTDCFIYKDILSQLNAEGLAIYSYDVQYDRCTINIEFGLGHVAKLKIGMYDWNQGEVDLIVNKLTEEGVFEPCLKSQKWVSFTP